MQEKIEAGYQVFVSDGGRPSVQLGRFLQTVWSWMLRMRTTLYSSSRLMPSIRCILRRSSSSAASWTVAFDRRLATRTTLKTPNTDDRAP